MTGMGRRGGAALAVALLLAGCASAPVPTSMAAARTNVEQLLQALAALSY